MLICYLGSNLWVEELAAKLLLCVFIYIKEVLKDKLEHIKNFKN